MRGRIICPKCGLIGRLEVARKDYYRINHDQIRFDGKSILRCYLGSLKTSYRTIMAVSQTRPDIIDPTLLEHVNQTDVKKLLERKKIDEEVENSGFATLIANLIHIGKRLGSGWNSEAHHLVKGDNCPYCKKRIQFRFIRIGSLKDNKFTVTDFSVQKRSHGLTRSMRPYYINRFKNVSGETER
jgi:hypothetical protein